MRDEEYVYYQDLKEKKSTGNSARKARTHCGKAGSKLPSDYLSKKELKNMNGEVKSYRLNEPMKWDEFKVLPEDLQKTYIDLLRQKWNVSVIALAKMFGKDRANLSKYLHDKLGYDNFPRGKHKWDKMGFMEWCYGLPSDKEEPVEEFKEEIPVEMPEEDQTAEFVEDTPVIEPKEETIVLPKMVIPTTGSMDFDGNAYDILKTIGVLLGGANVKLYVTWEVCDG